MDGDAGSPILPASIESLRLRIIAPVESCGGARPRIMQPARLHCAESPLDCGGRPTPVLAPLL